MDHGGDEGTQSRGEADGLTGRGGDMDLEVQSEAGDSTSCQAGGWEAKDGA